MSPKIFPRSPIYVSKASEMSLQTDQKKECKSNLACNGKTSMHFFAQMCSHNDQSDNFKVFNAFESSIKAFDNFFENHEFISHEYRIIEVSNFCTQTGSVRNGWKFPVDKMDSTYSAGYTPVLSPLIHA